MGFVPTMGALHAGHLSLVERALRECTHVVCSIFVNPLQFNDAGDLAKYPRPLAKDKAMLSAAGCHALFIPEAQGLLEGAPKANWDLGTSEIHWEGPSRPGHFQGVVSVVERLFHYVRPDRAYFGEKDRQQLTILRHVAQHERWPETLVPCPTMRDPDGLAMSSRNTRLSPDERKHALALSRALSAMREEAFRSDVAEVSALGRTMILSEPGLRLDYCGIAHPETLEPIDRWGVLNEAVALVAAYAGSVRLIDNMTLSR